MLLNFTLCALEFSSLLCCELFEKRDDVFNLVPHVIQHIAQCMQSWYSINTCAKSSSCVKKLVITLILLKVSAILANLCYKLPFIYGNLCLIIISAEVSQHKQI